jgi:hypothetical protein
VSPGSSPVPRPTSRGLADTGTACAMIEWMRPFLLSATLLLAGACTSMTSVQLQKIDSLRAEQNACLSGNVPQFEDGTSEPARIGHFVAMSCTVETDKLLQYAVPYASSAERTAFQRDAAFRATGFVLRARAQ